MAIFLDKLVEKLGKVFPMGHPAEAISTRNENQSYFNPITGTNTVIKTGSIFEQGLNNL